MYKDLVDKLDSTPVEHRKVIPFEEFQFRRIEGLCREACRQMDLADEEYLKSLRDSNFTE